MRSIHHVNEGLLHLLFDWKRKAGQTIRFTIEQQNETWVLSFISVGPSDKDTHIFASFTGKTHDELKKWALDRLVSYHISEILKV